MPQMITIKIQSISDIITNSSSEVFCTITGKDIEAIAELLKPLFCLAKLFFYFYYKSN